MRQIVDLQNDPNFQELNVQLVSISFDDAAQQQQGMAEVGISNTPMLVDANGDVSKAYDVLKWAVGTGEPGHTFVLVNTEGKIAWIKDYGSPDLPSPVMYVDTAELVGYIRDNLN